MTHLALGIVGCTGDDLTREVPFAVECADAQYCIDVVDASCCTIEIDPVAQSIDLEQTTFFIEPEQIVGEGGTWFRRDDQPGFSGDGFISAVWGRADCFRFRLPFMQQGTYRFWTRGFEGMWYDRSIELRVNNEPIGRTQSDPVLNRYRWQSVAEVELPSGPALVEVCDPNRGQAIFDAIAISKDTGYDPERREARFRIRDGAETAVLDDILVSVERMRERERIAISAMSPEDRASELKRSVLRAIGLDPLPPKTPLRTVLLGASERDGYRVERLAFESRPGFVVPALLFIPEGEGPFPAVVRPIGHWPGRGKSAPVPLTVSLGLVHQGYVVLTYDPFGQGERGGSGNSHEEHYRLLLSGQTNLSIMVWDSIRAIDLLLERPEVDGRIAITGASGGGLNSFYTSIVEERLSASVPVVYVTEWDWFLGTGHPHDNCSHVPGIVRIASAGELAGLVAPRAQALFSAAEDTAFPAEGTMLAAERARESYARFDAESALVDSVFGGGHDYSKAMREALYGFLDLHLRGRGDGTPKAEPPFEVPDQDDPDFRCFLDDAPTGSTARDLAWTSARNVAGRLADASSFRADQVTKALHRLLDDPDPGEPTVEITPFVEGDLRFEKWRIEGEGRVVSALYFLADERAPTIVYTDPALHTERHPAALLRANGFNVLHVSPAGHGETAWAEHLTITDHLMLGDPILVHRAADLVLARRALAQTKRPRAIGLLALHTDSAWVGLFAQALWREFDAAILGRVSGSFLDGFVEFVPRQAFVPRILEVADVPHLVRLASERPLAIGMKSSTANPMGRGWQRELAPFIRTVDREQALDVLRHWLR